MSLQLTWSVKRESGRPLLPADIERYELTVTKDGQPIDVGNPAVADTEFTFDADIGVYGIGLVCVPKKGAKSDPATGTETVFDETKVVIMDFTVKVVAP
jgi:hypothetical protein